MLKVVLIAILAIFVSICNAQRVFDYDLYLSGSIGFGIPMDNRTKFINSQQINYKGSEAFRSNLFLRIKDNFGIHLSVLKNTSNYNFNSDYIQIQNPDFYILEKDIKFNHSKTSVFIGLAYKIYYRRLVLVPFIDFGVTTKQNAHIDSYILKEHNANNMREYNNMIVSIGNARFDYSAGADIFFHIGKHYGISASILFDRVKMNTQVSTIKSDYGSPDRWGYDNIKFKNKHIVLSLGVFIASFKRQNN